MASWRDRCRCCDAPPATGRAYCPTCLLDIGRHGVYTGDLPSVVQERAAGSWASSLGANVDRTPFSRFGSRRGR